MLTALTLPPPPPSPARNLLKQHENRANLQITTLAKLSAQLFREFWYGPIPVEDLLTTLGVKACAWFDQHATTVGFLLQSGVAVDPADYTPPRAFTRHPDGTVTLN